MISMLTLEQAKWARINEPDMYHIRANCFYYDD